MGMHKNNTDIDVINKLKEEYFNKSNPEYPNGQSIFYFVNGILIEEFPDGRKVEFGAQG